MFKYKQNTQGIFALIGDGWRLYQASFTKVVLWTFLFQIIIQALIHLHGNPKTFNAIDVLLIIALIVVPFILVPMLTIIVFSIMHNIAKPSAQSLAPATAVRQFYWRVLGADLLITLYLFLAAIVLGILGVVLTIITHRHPALFFAIIGLVSMIALIIIFPYFSFYKPFILFDNVRIIKSLKSSFKLTYGNWWRTVAVLMAPGLILGIITIGVSFLFIVTKNTTAGIIVDTIISALLMPITLALNLVLFNDLKIRKNYVK